MKKIIGMILGALLMGALVGCTKDTTVEDYGYIVVYCCHAYSPTTFSENASSSCHGHKLSLRNLRVYDRNIPDEFKDTLDVMFGNEWELLSEEERWGGRYIVCHQMHYSIPHQYLQWTIQYLDGDLVKRYFTFDNRLNFHFHVTRHIEEMILQHYYPFYSVYVREFAIDGRISFSARIPMAEIYLSSVPYAKAEDPLWKHQGEAFRNGLETPEGAIPLTQITPCNVFEHMPIYFCILIPVVSQTCLCQEREDDERGSYGSTKDMISVMNQFTNYSLNLRLRLRFRGCSECCEIEYVVLRGISALDVSGHDDMRKQVMVSFLSFR